MKVVALLLVVIFLLATHAVAQEQVVTDAAQLSAGKILRLPAGTFKLGDLKLPAGSGVRGAGFAKTIIDSAGHDAGFVVEGVSKVSIEDLTIRGAASAGVKIVDASEVRIERIRVTDGVVGISVTNAESARIANCVLDHSNAGISMTNVRGGSTIVNCTIARMGSSALSFGDVSHTVVFNNVLADSGTATLVSGKHDGLVIDYNLYSTFNAGKIDGQVPRADLATWRTVSGYDRHSVNTGVAFADAAKGDFRPTTVLQWHPARMTTSDFGVAELEGAHAPEKDITGQSRRGPADLGAFEEAREVDWVPDGTFSVSDDEGVKSAGVFTNDGVLVRYLFQNLPLRKGEYPFVLPGGVDQIGRPIAVGKYEVRTVESDLGIEYRGFAGNLGVGNTPLAANALSIANVSFASDGNLLIGMGWGERQINLEKLDLATGKAIWGFKGSADNHGVTSAGDGSVIYLVRAAAAKSVQITRVQPQTGFPMQDAQGEVGAVLPKLSESPYLRGVAELGGRLYLADADANKLHVIDAKSLRPAESIVLPSPSEPSADHKRSLIWLLSDGKVTAIDSAGAVKHQPHLADRPIALACAGNLLAVADAASGKVTIFDITDPAHPKQQRQIGTGDGPYGTWQPDRFTFQLGRYNTKPIAGLALRPDGALAVKDQAFGHIAVFDPSGKPIHHEVAHFGNFPIFAYWNKEPATRVFENSGRMSFWVDTLKGKTGMDAYWGVTDLVQQPTLIGAFEHDGLRFAALRGDRPKPDGRAVVIIGRFDEKAHVIVPLSMYWDDTKLKKWVVQQDTNGDGAFDAQDAAPTELKDVPGRLTTRWIAMSRDGSIVSTSGAQLGVVWKFSGLDARRIPVYKFGPDLVLKRKLDKIKNPYDFSRETAFGQSETLPMPDSGGTAVCLVLADTPQGTGLSNSGATDIARFAEDGTLLWLRPMNLENTPIQGLKPLGRYMLTSYGHDAWWLPISNDGLGMGSFGPPAEFNWNLYWLDHPDHYGAFTGADGKTHILAGDYVHNMVHWMTITGEASIKHARFPMTIDAAKAQKLAARPADAYKGVVEPPAPQITIKRLDAPLTMDGDLAKWRKAVPAPQVLITPATATAGIDGPEDQSATVRIAYHGNTIYFQFLVFDDLIAQHQLADKFYLQDSVQMTINGFAEGFAFNASTLKDGTQLLFRNRFFFNKLDLSLEPAKAPRNYRILDSTADVPERSFIERAYGSDLSRSKVRAYEFALPIDSYTHGGDDGKALQRLKVAPGEKFWIGFMLNDVDTIGIDEQPLEVWPSTYGMFAVKEKGAIAVFE